MSKETEKPAEAGVPKKGNKLKLIIIAALVLILLGGGGFAYWFFAIHGKAQTGPKAAAQAVPDVPPTYSVLDPFTVNLKDPGVVMQAGITLKVHDEKVDSAIKLRMPEIRDQILLILSNQQSADLMTTAGKENLGKQIALAVNKILGANNPKDGVSQVLFTSFIIQ
ncbi:MAG TPA: flagellar basal body-associated protein FliL [Burkholderiales bacterium]|nr:flagellar basal body-associated protein FliL [Burkholderiales bacterium]